MSSTTVKVKDMLAIQGGIPRGELVCISSNRLPGRSLMTTGGYIGTKPVRRPAWQIAKEVEKLCGPRPLPTHYVTPLDMKGKWPRVLSKSEMAARIMFDYETSGNWPTGYFVIDSMSMYNFSSKVKPGTDGGQLDPWAQYRPRKGGYYDPA